MSERERIQLNLRLDGQKELYEAVKDAAARQNASVNAFVINALKSALGWEIENHTSQVSSASLETILEAVDNRLDSRLDEIVDRKINERLGKLAA